MSKCNSKCDVLFSLFARRWRWYVPDSGIRSSAQLVAVFRTFWATRHFPTTYYSSPTNPEIALGDISDNLPSFSLSFFDFGYQISIAIAATCKQTGGRTSQASCDKCDFDFRRMRWKSHFRYDENCTVWNGPDTHNCSPYTNTLIHLVTLCRTPSDAG